MHEDDMIAQENDRRQLCQEKITWLRTYGSIKFLRKEQLYVSEDSFNSLSTQKGLISSFPIIPPQIITTKPL